MITRHIHLHGPNPGKTVVTSKHWDYRAFKLDELRIFFPDDWKGITDMVQITLESEPMDIFLAKEIHTLRSLLKTYYVWATVLIVPNPVGQAYFDIWSPGKPGNHLGAGYSCYWSSVEEFKDQLLIDSI